MRPAPSSGKAKPAFFGLAALLLLLATGPGLALGNWWVLAGTLVVALTVLAALHRLSTQLESRVLAAEAKSQELQGELEAIHLREQSRREDLAALGRYGNLLIGCRDLAEVLQVSEQVLSQLLPNSAGTIYPLTDGEGLAEATHLWGLHVVQTHAQASADDCWCMKHKRLHASRSDEPDSLCTHLLPADYGNGFKATCIPLLAQGEALGWIYLSTPGYISPPDLQVALAASDQLALALANLKLRQSLGDLSVRDPLTGLFNRRYLAESLGREMSRSKRREHPLAVMAFDLDHFKDFNDSYGHPAGDAILVAFARILQSHSRNEDIACRQGGEEFVVIMPEMGLEVALRRAAELMAKMASMDVMHDGRLLPKVTTSIGLAIFPQHGTSPDALLLEADQALYRAKSLGRNQVAVAKPPQQLEARPD